MDPYTILVILHFCGAGVALAVAAIAWRRRAAPGAAMFTVFMLAVGIWVFAYAMEILSSDLAAMHTWSKFEYTAPIVAPSWLIVTLQYVGAPWLTRRRAALLYAIPALILALAWTNEWHGLIWHHLTAAPLGPYSLMAFDRGPAYWLNMAYAYSIVTAFMVVTVRAFVRARGVYRRQMGTLLLASIFPVVGSFMYITGLTPWPGLDLAPFGFLFAGVFALWAVLRYQLLDIVPVARDAVIENMRDAVLVIDTQLRIVDANPAAEAVMGRPAAEVIGQPGSAVFADQAMYGSCCAMFDSLESAAQREVALGRAGSLRYYDAQRSPLYDRRGRITGHLVVLRDITERKAMEAERERLIEELDAFAHTVAHDLKNPLSSVMFSSQSLEEGLDALSAEVLHDYAGAITRGAGKMRSIIDALLLLASVRRQGEVVLAPLDMGAVVGEVCGRLGPMLAGYGGEFVLAESWPVALGYAPWVEEVWVNYVSNAIKYGGTPPRVQLGAAALADRVRFWVQDDGPGLTPEAQAGLFTAFTRLDNTRVDGHGLGLSIVQRIVERLGGEVGVESAPGAGSCFWFTLPRCPAEAPTGESAQPPQPAIPTG